MGILHDHAETPHSTTVTKSTTAFNIKTPHGVYAFRITLTIGLNNINWLSL